MGSKPDRLIPESQALDRLAAIPRAIDSAESWLARQIERTYERSLADLHSRKGTNPATRNAALDGTLQLTRVSSGQVLVGRELVLAGDRSSLETTTQYADISGAIESRALDMTRRLDVELARDERCQDRLDTLASRVRNGSELAAVKGGPIAWIGMTGPSSPTATYEPCRPEQASASQRKPLANPTPGQLLSAGWTGVSAGLSRVDVIGGRAISPQYRATTIKKTRRGKRSGRKHKGS